MEVSPKKKSTFVNVIAWLMMGFGAFGLLFGSVQLFLFSHFMQDDFYEETISPGGDIIDQVISISFRYLPYVLGVVLVAYALQILVGYGLWKRLKWAWMASLAVFAMMLMGTIAMGVGQQLIYSFIFSGLSDPGLAESEFFSIQLIVRLMAGMMMLAFAGLWAWILYRLSRPAIRAEFT